MSAPTLEEICKKVEVSIKALDQECTDEGRCILAKYCGRWQRVARKLFSKSDTLIEDIERDNDKNEDQRSEFIRKWHTELADKATYSSFMEALLKLKLASNVKEALTELKEENLLG